MNLIDKKLPSAIESEDAIIGAILYNNNSLIDAIQTLKPEMLSSEKNKVIYQTMCEMFARNEPIDIVTLVSCLRKKNQINDSLTPYMISTLDKGLGDANLNFNILVVVESWIKRQLILFGDKMVKNCFEEASDIFKELDSVDNEVLRIYSIIHNNAEESYDEILTTAYNDIINSDSTTESGVPSGIKSLDRVTSGFQNSDMIVLAARPAMGKSGLMTTIARNAANCGFPIAIFSLEMNKFQLVCRLIAEDIGIDVDVLTKKKLSAYQKQMFRNAIDNVRGLPIHIDDKPAINIVELRAKLKQMKKKYDIKMAIVDYLQLMTGNSKGSREQEVSEISRGIKTIAKELNIPIIALSQLSRSNESRADKRPLLSDLRESGAIEQDADVVMFIHRPEYYGITVDEIGNSTKGLAEIIFAKHRNGSVETVACDFVGQFTVFKDLRQEIKPIF